MRVSIELTFPKGYIAEPYWPAREKLINVQKESGINRARSEVNRTKALRDYLNAHDMTMDDYAALQAAADRPFYTWADVEDDLDGSKSPDEIVIPAHQFYGCLAQSAGLASTSIRLARPEQIRTVLAVSDFATGKHQGDGVWERFVTVSAGTGQRLSNQRALRSSAYLGPCLPTGTLTFSEDIVRAEKVKEFISFAGREVGVGASRKLAWGRFVITGWEERP